MSLHRNNAGHLDLILPIFVSSLAVIVRLSSGSYPVDDAFITFRYARNIAEGVGPYFNPGEAVLGTSTPLLTTILATLAALGRTQSIPTYALVVNSLADGFTVLMLYKLARKLGLDRPLATLIGLLQGFAPISLRYALGGMEASLVTALTIGCLSAHLARRENQAATLAAWAILTRPDALAVGAVLIISQLIEGWRFPWRSLAILLAWILPVAALEWLLYGVPVPHSVLTKSAPIYSVPPESNAIEILTHFAGLFFGSPFGLAARGIIVSIGGQNLPPLILIAVLQGAIWGVGASRAIRADRRWGALAAYPLVFAGAYGVFGISGSSLAEWYLVSLVPFYLLFLGFGVHQLLRRVAPHAFRAGAYTIVGLMLLSELTGLNWGRDPSRALLVPISVWVEREELYRHAAKELVPLLQSQDVVAASEIGALGYYCDCRILDTVGIVTPIALKYYPLPESVQQPALNAVPAELIRDQQPEFIVSLEAFVRYTLLVDEWFNNEYDLILEFETAAFGSRGLLVFQRNH